MYNGEWFGPNQFSQVIESLVNRKEPSNFLVHIPFANCLYIDRILAVCQSWSCSLTPTSSSTSSSTFLSDSEEDYEDYWKPLWILIPSLLGMENIGSRERVAEQVGVLF
jgi:hypothetical protein